MPDSLRVDGAVLGAALCACTAFPSLSHHATFRVLANTRVRLLDKLATAARHGAGSLLRFL